MTAKGKRQNPITVELRANSLRGQKRSVSSREKISQETKRRWKNGVYNDVNFHPKVKL